MFRKEATGLFLKYVNIRKPATTLPPANERVVLVVIKCQIGVYFTYSLNQLVKIKKITGGL